MLDVGQAIGVAEAQESFAVDAEGGARQARHTGFLQQSIRQLAAADARAGNVRKGIEGPIWLEAAHTWQGIQARDDCCAAGRELHEHAVHGILRTFQSSNGRLLRKARRTADRVRD